MNIAITRRTLHSLVLLPLLATALCAASAYGAPQGELDDSFGENGRITIGPQYERTLAGAVAQQADGKLLVAGSTWVTPSGIYDFLVLRRNADGSPDASFGTDGSVLIDFYGFTDIATDLAVQSDGKIVIAGYAGRRNNGFDIALTRLKPDGTIDPSFGSRGRSVLDLGGDLEYITRIIVLPNDKIAVVGASNVDGTYEVVFARFHADGTVDGTFGTGAVAGTTRVDSGDLQHQPYWMTLQSDGKLLACGQSSLHAYDAAGGRLLAIRVNPDGSMDGGFGKNGISVIDTGAPLGGGRGCVAMPDGKTVLAGFAGITADKDLLLVRLTSSGLLDKSFGDEGYSRIDLGGSESLQFIARLADGSLGVTGLTGVLYNEASPDPLWGFEIPGNYSDALVARIDPDSGLLDPDFGNDGVTLLDFGAGDLPSLAFARRLIQQADGKLLVMGASVQWGDWWNYHRIALARVDPAGGGSAGIASFINDYLLPNEGEAQVLVPVRRTGGSTSDLSIDYTAMPESANAPDDFAATSGTLTWLSGDTAPKFITVPITDDTTTEPIEAFQIVLSSPDNRAGFSSRWVSIEDNDPVQPPPPPAQPEESGGGGAESLGELMILAMIWGVALRRRRLSGQ